MKIMPSQLSAFPCRSGSFKTEQFQFFLIPLIPSNFRLDVRKELWRHFDCLIIKVDHSSIVFVIHSWLSSFHSLNQNSEVLLFIIGYKSQGLETSFNSILFIFVAGFWF